MPCLLHSQSARNRGLVLWIGFCLLAGTAQGQSYDRFAPIWEEGATWQAPDGLLPELPAVLPAVPGGVLPTVPSAQFQEDFDSPVSTAVQILPVPSERFQTLTELTLTQLEEEEKKEQKETQGSGSGSNSGGANQNANSQQREPLGQAPEDNSLLFLRRNTVLLRPGQFEIDYGLNYSWQESRRPTIVGNSLLNERRRVRSMIVPMAIRWGWKPRLQPFLNIPFGSSNSERSNAAFNEWDAEVGLGDISAGLTFQLVQQDNVRPDIVGSVSFSAPTGEDGFEPRINVASLGNGYWTFAVAFNFIKSYDPVVTFGSIGYRHEFAVNALGVRFQPGEVLNYGYGLGFAVNDRVTLSATVFGSAQFETTIDGDEVPNSSSEAISMRFAMTGLINKCLIVEPSVRMGLTGDAADAVLGVVWTRRY